MFVVRAAFRPLDLALGKNVVMAAVTSGFAAAAFSTIVATGPPAQEEQLSLVVVLLTVWAGAGPGALGSSLQTYAQASVSATTAQVCVPAASPAALLTALPG
jgi:drug/metabolite transporter (DMT)-like permease